MKVPLHQSPTLRDPSLDEAARIVRKLNECFDAGRYLDGWTDRKIADALNMPWLLVAKVREQFCGPLKEDPAVTALRSDVESWMTMGAELKARLAQLAG